MSYFNDEQRFAEMARNEQQSNMDGALAPQHKIYAAILECAASHMENNDVKGAEAILNSLQFAIKSAREWVSQHPVTTDMIMVECNY